MIALHEGQTAFDDESLQQQLDFISNDSYSSGTTPASSAVKKYKCDRKCCSVGRNQAKRSSWFRQKIHFVDVTKLRQPKLCMKAHLVGDDCKPLLIKAGEDVTVPLVSPEGQKKAKKKQQRADQDNNKNSGGHQCGKCGLLLDALARTFCLPLLG